MKTLSLFGATGSIGRNVLKIVDSHSDEFRIKYLSFHKNWDEGLKIAEKYNPDKIIITDEESFSDFIGNANPKLSSKVVYGNERILEFCADGDVDLVVNALVGEAGLLPTIKSLEAGVDVALANKESLVMAGDLINNLKEKHSVDVFPIDSEHSAIWQCILGEPEDSIKKIILTASGGPFREYSLDKLQNVTVDMALNHPNWSMGKKITIDSATLMNKGLEFIEAYWLYPVSVTAIDVVVHPQSIVHSLVEFVDGSIKAQLGFPDMRIPIQYALTYPNRLPLTQKNFNLAEIGRLDFEPVRHDLFPAITLAKLALMNGGISPAVLNVANEYAVYAFLDEKIPFLEIENIVKEAITAAPLIESPNLDDILQAGDWAREFVNKRVN